MWASGLYGWTLDGNLELLARISQGPLAGNWVGNSPLPGFGRVWFDLGPNQVPLYGGFTIAPDPFASFPYGWTVLPD